MYCIENKTGTVREYNVNTWTYIDKPTPFRKTSE